MSTDLVIAAVLLVGGAGYLAMARYVWMRRDLPGATTLFVALLAIFVYTAGYAVQMTTETIPAAAVWTTVKYLGIVTLPPALLAFAVEYTTQRRLSSVSLALLAIEPTVVMLLLVNPATHHLMLVYDSKQLGEGSPPWPVGNNGVLFLPHLVYSYVVLISALALTGWRLARLASPYRVPAVAVITTSLLPMAGNAAYNFAYKVIWIDPTPFLFTLLAVVLVWGFFRMGLIDLAPIARSAVMDQMTDAVLVLDVNDRVGDMNPSAAILLGRPTGAVVGRVATEVLPDLEEYLTEVPTDALGTPSELELGGLDLAVQVSPLTDGRGRNAGRLVVLRDVTERTRTERQLRAMLKTESDLATVLQASLRPASLPSVPGVRMAARSLPAGAHVSGDFYDVHQVLGGDWAFVLGDVAGKGVHAAVVTSMARYTARTLSAQGWSPKQVMSQLNQALLIDSEPERFCTVVYGTLAQIDQPDGAPRVVRPDEPLGGGQGVRLTLALAGHPPPLVRRRDGRVDAVGRTGTALGVVSVVEIEEATIDLEPGEVLVAYTDGVTEARRDGVEFGEDRLAWALATAASGLRGQRGASAAALTADAVADRILEAVTAFARQRDDIALLVLAVC